MFNISQFLEKFRVMGQRNMISRETIAEALSEGLDMAVSTKDFKVQDNVVVFTNAGSCLKNQVFIKKQKLLGLLKEKCKDGAPCDIR